MRVRRLHKPAIFFLLAAATALALYAPGLTLAAHACAKRHVRTVGLYVAPECPPRIEPRNSCCTRKAACELPEAGSGQCKQGCCTTETRVIQLSADYAAPDALQTPAPPPVAACPPAPPVWSLARPVVARRANPPGRYYSGSPPPLLRRQARFCVFRL